MSRTVSTTTSTAASDRIFRELSRRMARGEFAHGDKVPSRKVLSSKYSVSPSTVTNALRRLRADGAVHYVEGQGLFFVNPQGEAEGRDRDMTGQVTGRLGTVGVWGQYLPRQQRMAHDGAGHARREPIVDGIWAAAAERGTQLILAPEPVTETGDAAWAERHAIDGLVLVGGHPPDWSSIAALSCPVVTCNYLPHRTPIPAVDYDNAAMLRDAIDRFVAAGHRRIGYLNTRTSVPDLLEHWRRTFFTGCMDHGLVYDMRPCWRIIDHTTWKPDEDSWQAIRQSVQQVLDDWLALDDPPTAVFVHRPQLARLLDQAAEQRGVKLTLFSVFNEWSEAFCPGYLCPHERIGRRLIDLLEERAAGTTLTRHELIERRFIDPETSEAAQAAAIAPDDAQ